MCLGVPGKIVDVYESNGLQMAKVDFGGIFREACLSYVPEAKVGEYCIIHVGFAISLLSEKDAMETLELLRQMGSLEEELGKRNIMKYVTEYRDAEMVKGVIEEILRTVTRPWTLMEICGGQTHSIVRHGIDQLLPPQIELVHGPGCPVCVTPLELIDKALSIAARPDVIFCSYGDMLRVPGSNRDLFSVKAQGGDVRVVYSPLDAVTLAQKNPDKQVVFFAIGFETTAPPNVMSVLQAQRLGLKNFSILVSHVRVPPAIDAILSSPHNRVQGFLLAGHVNAVMGYHEYPPLVEKFGIPMVVTGFEPLDLVQGILKTVQLLEEGKVEVANAYQRAVTFEGLKPAQDAIHKVFMECDRKWRGIGMIPMSGWGLRPEFDEFNAEKRFDVESLHAEESPLCIAGQILQGLKKPHHCPAFGKECTPENPLGATMVSSEGACAAYYRYGRNPQVLLAEDKV